MKKRLLLFLTGLLFAAALSAGASELEVPLASGDYAALSALDSAGLIQNYPSDWILSGHPLTRFEIAYYIRLALQEMNRRENDTSPGGQAESDTTVATLSQLVQEYRGELEAFGVGIQQAESAPVQVEQPVYVDLDSFLAMMREQITPSPGAGGAPPGGTVIDIGQVGTGIDLGGNNGINDTYYPIETGSLDLPSMGFGIHDNSAFRLADELLGFDPEPRLSDTAGQAKTPAADPLRLGSLLISGESQDEENVLDIPVVGDQLGLGIGALWFFDLDQAQVTMDRLLVDVHTEVELTERLDLFGSLSLDYQNSSLAVTPSAFDSKASTWLRFVLGDDLYLIAEYSLGLSPQGWQGAKLSLDFGNLGLFLLGQGNLDDPEELGLTLGVSGRF